MDTIIILTHLSEIDRSLEQLSRGGNVNIDLQTLINTVIKVFDWVSIQHNDYDDDRSSNSDKDNLKISVSIYNKARNLPSGTYDILKALLKGMSAYLLHLYSKPSAKCLSTVIKLFSRASEEISCFDIYIEYAIKCATTCGTLWKRIRDSSSLLIKQLTTNELEALKMSVYHSYTQIAVLLVNAKEVPNRVADSPRQAIAGALELVNLLPPGIKLNFIHTAMHVGKELIKKNCQEDAFSIYNLTIAVVDQLSLSPLIGLNISATDNDDGNSENYVKASKYDLFRMKIKIMLSMAYCCMTTKQAEKAMLHVKQAEQAIEKSNFDKRTFSEQEKASLYSTLDYAKFSVCAAECNWTMALEYLRNYMKQASNTSYETALELVTTFLKGNQQNNHKFTIEFYGMLLSSFPNEPFFTNTRISNLETIVANVSIHGEQSTTSDVSQNKKAIDLCDAIITDHLNGTHSLHQETDAIEDNGDITKNFKRVIKVLIGRVKWHYSSSEWIKLKDWADLYFKLHSDKELDDDTMNVMIYKVEALLSENEHRSNEDALALALKMATTRTTTRSIISLFKALLFTRGAKDAVKHFIDLQNNREVDGNVGSALGKSENLSRIIECLLIVNESSKLLPAPQCKLAKQLLLQQWLSQFSDIQYWRHEGYANEVNDRKITYFIMCRQLLQVYLAKDDADDANIEQTKEQDNKDNKDNKDNTTHSMDVDVDTNIPELAKLFGSIVKFNEQLSSISLIVSLDDFRANLINPLLQLCHLMSSLDKGDVSKLGADEDLEWLADLAYNLGLLFSKKQHKTAISSSEAAGAIKQKDYFQLAAELLDISSTLYGRVDNEDKTVSISNQVMCLIASTGCRLDMDSCDVRKTFNKQEIIASDKSNDEFHEAGSDSGRLSSCFDKSDSSLTPFKASPKRSDELLKTIKQLEYAESLVRLLIGFADESQVDSYKMILIVFLISAHLRLHDEDLPEHKLDEFMQTRAKDFFILDAKELRRCATIAKAEFHLDVARTFLNMAHQVCVRVEPRDYALLGQIFHEIIENSASRCHALETIQQFEQLVKSNTAFSIDDIDSVAKLSYNYGVTLLELDQIDMAEKFMSMSLSLSKFASDSFKANLEVMQSSYAFVLEQKAQARGSASSKAVGMDLMHETPHKMNYEKEKEVAITLASFV